MWRAWPSFLARSSRFRTATRGSGMEWAGFLNSRKTDTEVHRAHRGSERNTGRNPIACPARLPRLSRGREERTADFADFTDKTFFMREIRAIRGFFFPRGPRPFCHKREPHLLGRARGWRLRGGFGERPWQDAAALHRRWHRRLCAGRGAGLCGGGGFFLWG